METSKINNLLKKEIEKKIKKYQIIHGWVILK